MFDEKHSAAYLLGILTVDIAHVSEGPAGAGSHDQKDAEQSKIKKILLQPDNERDRLGRHHLPFKPPDGKDRGGPAARRKIMDKADEDGEQDVEVSRLVDLDYAGTGTSASMDFTISFLFTPSNSSLKIIR